MAEERINTDRKPENDRDELMVDELEEIAGGQEQQHKVTSEQAQKRIG